ncbi:hypothetical protein [uncultured Roseibium sp.]|uniref:hypothetical protein n=1 Tax=uncultured Roseibium sp. TaxID=1936171 RepID=UPI00261C1E4C|nr:hypothetical protein [uncultured Roseibium sp.]
MDDYAAVVLFTACVCLFVGFVGGNMAGAESVAVREWISALSGIVGGLVAAAIATWIGVTQLKPILRDQKLKERSEAEQRVLRMLDLSRKLRKTTQKLQPHLSEYLIEDPAILFFTKCNGDLHQRTKELWDSFNNTYEIIEEIDYIRALRVDQPDTPESFYLAEQQLIYTIMSMQRSIAELQRKLLEFRQTTTETNPAHLLNFLRTDPVKRILEPASKQANGLHEAIVNFGAEFRNEARRIEAKIVA